MNENKFLEIDYTRYGNDTRNYFSQLTDEVIARGMAKYLRKYMWGKWSGISVRGQNFIASDFFQTAEIKPARFYEIFRSTEPGRAEKFLDYFKEYNVKAEIEPGGFLSLVDQDKH